MLVSLPDVFIAIVLLLFAVKTHALPVGGMSSADSESFSAGAQFADTLRHLALPLTALVLSLLPMLLRHVRSAMREALDAPFVNAARAHGILRQRILWRHALPAAANPLISLFGISLATMLSASLLIEIIMSWPGMGPLFLEAILARDIYLVIGAVMFSSLLLLAGNLVADMLLLAVDPRMHKS